MKLKGCTVVIKCNGKEMREYSTTVWEDGEGISCHIASQPGEEFWIEYSCNLNYLPPNTQLAADVYFGGELGGAWMAMDPLPGDKKVFGEIWTSRCGDKFHKLVFSVPEIVAGETPSSTDPEQLGDILVRLGFVADSTMVEHPSQCLSTIGSIKVNEKDKKPGAHYAGPAFEESTDTDGCSGPVFYGTAPAEDALLFQFACRAEEWLEAKGIKRKRRLRGKAEPARYSEASPLPKPEPVEVGIPATKVLAGTGVLSQPQTQPRSPTPLSYADEGPQIQDKGETHPASQSTGRGGQQPTPSEVDTPERPRKIPRLSRNTPSATGSKSRKSRATRSPAKSGSNPKVEVEADGPAFGVKAEDDDLVPQVKVQESDSIPRVKVEEGGPIPRVKVEERGSIPRVKVEEGASVSGVKAEEDCSALEMKVEGEGSAPRMEVEKRGAKEEARGVAFNELNELKAEEKELEKQIALLEKKRASLRGKITALPTSRPGTETGSPRPKVKTEGGSTSRAKILEVIDLTD